MSRSRRLGASVGLALGLAAAACFDGQFLALEPCSRDRDCGRNMQCIDGVCGGYDCPVDKVDGVCPCPGRPKYECEELSFARTNKVDILFVIDNTGTVAQLNLVRLAADLRAALDTSLVDYRIAITTTDAGNPFWCPDSTPERGEFVFSSCRQRLDDFVYEGNDYTEECLANCKYDVVETVPTPNDDEQMIARPWLEVRPDGSNLPPGTDVDDALRCAILQGVNGCGFEAHLESLWLALDGANTPGSPNFGFIRPDAHLMVVIFTNEADCSLNDVHQTIFDPAGDRVFWSDQNAEAPTSALCWNAGVECIGGPTPYYDCLAVDKAESGALTLAHQDAVLHPLQRYLEQFEAVRQVKYEHNKDLEVFVELIAGVPDNYGEAPLVYSSVADVDPAFEHLFGIGPGCFPEDLDPDAPSISHAAVPPVRLLEFAQATAPNSGDYNVFSYCEDEFQGAFVGISNALDATIPALCMSGCVEDEGACELSYREGGESVPMTRCALDNQELPILDGEDLCFYSRSGSALADECRMEGANLQFGFLSTNGVEIPQQIYAACPPIDGDDDCPG